MNMPTGYQHSSEHSRVRSLLDAARPGYSLPRELYTDPDVFKRDLRAFVFEHWFCVGHVSSLKQPGDFFLAGVGQESIIIVRGRDHTIRALLNVCRHRGSRLCTEVSGSVTGVGFVCPYHAWTYGLDGHLISAVPGTGNGSREQLGLRSLPIRIIEGLIFTTFAADPLGMTAVERALQLSAGTHGWGRAKVAHRETFVIHANWKLAVENYMECYHCQPAHPEFTQRHAYARPAAAAASFEAAGHERSRALGIAISNVDQYGLAAPAGQESVAVLRSALLGGFQTGSADGAPLAPPMGEFRSCDGNSTYFDVGPISDFLAYADHGLVYRFIPRTVDRTEVEVVWLVDANAVEGRDYDLERLTWLWRVTTVQDKTIIERNMEGVSSHFYVPGPYSAEEPYCNRFTSWYLRGVGADA